ncbi:hypothetical protein [Pseudonocardia broussonetiae]|uniref:DUF4145 domain-containing protein n=1 Tax=Pseudonocardia broussonetiae TaxID=2736640 RepID=A0A6M6JDJ5_9PSEU|nr:hypothetical protein [Pseudonocardia broussonetiae]QJY45140.1 hypothetical protein HOP40_04285 [Pseudonocardia broussonetiae]
MTYSKRIETMRVIAGGHPSLSQSNKIQAIYGEFNSIKSCFRRKGAAGWLLSVLYTTRALDTCLSEIISSKHWTPKGAALGGYLKELEARAVLTAVERQLYQATVVKKRNRYMHEAGATPSNVEADRILTDMHACFVIVTSRV